MCAPQVFPFFVPCTNNLTGLDWWVCGETVLSTSRPFPFEGELPVVEITRAIITTGFRGVVSLEVFLDRLSERDKIVPHEMIERAKRAWGRCFDVFPEFA
jgi:sugar phosphate isomerase/epimerase